MGIQTRWFKRTGEYQYAVTYYSIDDTCSLTGTNHRKNVVLGRGTELLPSGLKYPHTQDCDCGKFTFNTQNRSTTDNWTTRTPFWCALDDENFVVSELPIGALYVTEPDYPAQIGYDGLCVMCVTPDGHWCIDSRASNCTRKEDEVHKCWVRHGTVGERVHVDKVGNTCSAGAGSIIIGKYHGFLHNGELTNA